MKSLTQFLKICLSMALVILSIESHAANMQEQETQVKDVMIPLSGSDIKEHTMGPKRGESMASVKTKYGNPIQIHPAKGKPPITRWDYPEFSVYFESNYVIHTVRQNDQSR